MLRIYFIALVFLTGFTASATPVGIMLRPGAMYWSHSFKNGANPESTETVKHFDLIVGLGYRMDTGLYLGATYTWMQEETKNEPGSEEKDTHVAYGPTIGYVGENLYILGTYHISPVYVTGTDASKDTYEGGYGYQFDFGYMFWVSANVGVGPQLTYYYANFKKIKASGGSASDLPNTAAVTDIRPIVAFSFSF